MKLGRILVADDEKRIVENITRCLEREGHQTQSAYDGNEAIKIFDNGKFDLALLDVNMPGRNGYEVMEHILSRDEDVMVIIITGYVSLEAAIQALKKGAWDYLKKPFEYNDLIKTVQNALSQRTLLTAKKAVHARLEASELQYEYMVNNSPDLIFTLDQDGRFSFINDQFEKILGIPPQDFMNTSFQDILHEGDREKALSLIQSSDIEKNQNRPENVILRFLKDNGNSHAFMELKTTSVFLPASDEKPEFRGIYVVARDVTERINLENQLRQAQKMEAIGTLAGGIAHDFNNILMGIQGYASLVKGDFDQESDAYKRLSTIEDYVFSGAEMTKQLLDFAQKTSQETCFINLNYLLKDAAQMFGRTKKDIIIEQYLEKKLWGTVVDEGQVKQVLLNLFVNAWQAMPDGGKITIKSENVVIDDFAFHDPGVYVKVTVSDTGVGMSEEVQERIFDPFFTTKTREQGTGIGLATAYGIIKSHNGIIKVESTLGKGSSFMFFLPAEKTEVDSRADESERHIFTGKGTVLLVDDEEGVLEVCSEMIKTLGYDVEIADSGLEAISILKTKKDQIDLVLLDMIMPGMSGVETYDEIKELVPDMKIIVSSGFSRESEIDKIMEKGCEAFILKPFDIATLSEKIKSVFKSSAEE